MKIKSLIVVLFLFTGLTLLGQNKLPVPSKSFIENAKYHEDPEERYFSKYLGKQSEQIVKRYDDSKEVCAKEFKFKTGIQFKRNSCSEAGTSVVIIFPNYSKKEVLQFIDWFFKAEGSVWNKAKTKYQPKQDGDAGCYIQIKESKGKIILNYSCGC